MSQASDNPDLVLYTEEMCLKELEQENPAAYLALLKRVNYVPEMIITDPDFSDHYQACYNEKISKKKNGQVSNEILKLLDKKELDHKYLDIGEYNGLFYYGFDLDGKEAILMSNGKILRNKQLLVTEAFKKGLIDFSLKRLLIGQQGLNATYGTNEIKKNFDYCSCLGDIAPKISNETIKRFVLKEKDTQLISPKKLYLAIKNKILYYMDFAGQDEIADVMTCWIFGTYCYPLFYWFPHILINAPSGSGKSKCANVIIQMAFRGFDLGAAGGVSPPQIFRTLEGNRGTALIDEFELAKKGVGEETQRLVNQILNSACSRDAYVIRTEQINKKWKAYKFPIFSPKITCNITGINPTSLSRYIAFRWLKTGSEKGKRKPTRESDKNSFRPIVDDLYIFMLENWQKIKNVYDNLEIDLSNRVEDNWLPLFAIAKFIDGCEGNAVGAETGLLKYLSCSKEVEVETNNYDGDFFRALFNSVEETPKYFTPKEIASFADVQAILSFMASPAHWIGKQLSNYKFKNNNRAGGIKKYLLSKENVAKIIDLYFCTEQTTHNNTNNTNSTKQHIIAQDDVSLCAVCAITPEVTPGLEIAEEIDLSKEVIHAHCSICKVTPCVGYDNRNKPLCEVCFKAYEGNKGSGFE